MLSFLFSDVPTSGDELPGLFASVVRQNDYDRYVSALFAPEAVREQVFALYAFNYEIARIAESVRNPLAGEIRLQWWREGFDKIYAGRPGRTELLKQLAEAITRHRLPKVLFESMLDARELDLEPAPFRDRASVEAYCDATSGNLMRLAARILGASERADGPAGDAGIAYAIAGLLRALAFNAARSRIILPARDMAEEGVTERDILAGRATPELSKMLVRMAGLARAHFERIGKVDRRFLPAILPVALVPASLQKTLRPGFNPFRDSTEIHAYRRQLILLRAFVRGRV